MQRVEYHGLGFVKLPNGYKVYKGQNQRCDRMTSGWVGPFDVAKLYAPEPCCYMLSRDVTLFDMSLPNIRRLIESDHLNDVTIVSAQGTKSLKDEFEKTFVKRKSYFASDVAVFKGLCRLFKVYELLGCDGYWAPQRTRLVRKNGSVHHETFHTEMAFCRPKRVLVECDGTPVTLLPPAHKSVDPYVPQWIGTSVDGDVAKHENVSKLAGILRKMPTKREVDLFEKL